MISLSVVQNKVFDKLMNMVKDPNFFPGWANTRALAMYSQAQMDRWTTEGGSQNHPWEPVQDTYAQRKKRMFGGGVRLSGARKGESYPAYFGQGTKTLIATSRLLASVLPPQYRDGPTAIEGEEFRKTVTEKSLEIATAVPYSVFVDEVRPFSVWDDSFIKELKDDFKAYVSSSSKGALS